MSIYIKNVKLKSNLILAPMAGFSDVAFRNLCLKYGAGLVTTEMISSKALSYDNQKTIDMLATLDSESPKAVQIFGHDPKVMAEAVKNPLLEKFDIIDINMGCPAPKITSNGDGSALLKNMNLASEIIRECSSSTKKPITVKFRIGYDEDENVAVEFAKMCEKSGAAAITVHGRTRAQGYSGEVDYQTIKKVKESVNIPVFANGNITTKEEYKKVLKLTNADGIMIGRAALGEPEIFEKILKNKEKKIDKFSQIEWHYKTLLNYFPEKKVVLDMRSHLANYLKGEYKNTKLLIEILKLTKVDEILRILRNYFN